MSDKPILFSAPMVRALLDLKKTQTRRVVKGAALDWLAPDMFTPEFVADPGNSSLCPYGKPGDRLWVRETFAYTTGIDDESLHSVKYRADVESEPWAAARKDRQTEPQRSPWKPSIFMPRWASRIMLEITEVRVQRLQEITLADARAEGCEVREFSLFGSDKAGRDKIGAIHYRMLWESINGPGSWDANPWVWAVRFKVCKP